MQHPDIADFAYNANEELYISSAGQMCSARKVRKPAPLRLAVREEGAILSHSYTRESEYSYILRWNTDKSLRTPSID